jgi:menaquinone-specific isochorismate synthase
MDAMIAEAPSGTRVALVDAPAALRAQLDALLARETLPTARIVRMEVSLEPTDPLAWLHAQPHAAKFYWSERHEDDAVAAVGVADLHTSSDTHADLHTIVARLQQRLATAAPDVRYYGGFRFDQHHAAHATWQRFGAYRFVLPQWELRRHNNETTLAANIVLSDDAPLLGDAVLDQIVVPGTGSLLQTMARPTARIDLPDQAGWQRMIDTALHLFDSGVLHKIVLARKAMFRCDTALDALALLARLRAITPNSFHFCFQPEHGLAFIGATPERLYSRVGRTLRSEAIAGTRPNGATAADTARLSQELLYSEKDVREHVFVREQIGQQLAPLCSTLAVAPEPALLRLTRRQHLWTPISGQLHDHVDDADLLSRLHPTSAVGGEPTMRALQHIAELEPFDRGWYAGPLGWISQNSAEFAVAIRSGLVDGAQLALYSGAGIVPGSTPDGEWNEIENKISDFVNVLRAER